MLSELGAEMSSYAWGYKAVTVCVCSISDFVLHSVSPLSPVEEAVSGPFVE